METHLLDGLPNPIKPLDDQSHNGLDRHLTHQLKTYGIEDPTVKREKAAPLGIVQPLWLRRPPPPTPTRHVTKLVQLGFYFCLRYCEFTKCTGHLQTVHFRPLLDFVFFVGDELLPADTSIEYFQNAIQIVLALDNQKNEIQGESVSHF